jgi:hypothetical protein
MHILIIKEKKKKFYFKKKSEGLGKIIYKNGSYKACNA